MSGSAAVKGFNGKQFAIWMGALILGGVLGALNIASLDEFFNFIAAIYTRLFQFIAVPTIALAVLTTLATMGKQKNSGKLFFNTIMT